MNEFEILQYAQSSFQQNAGYLLVVTILVCLNFYLIRRARETSMPVYGKAIVTIFSLMSVNFGWLVGTFLYNTQTNMAFRLAELKNSGVNISAASESIIDFFGNPAAPSANNTPDIPTMIFWGIILLMLILGMWAPASEGAYDKK
jgi:hypothetical protein|tara:strand:- start:121 stop:555 length:435 start_codon:yes stop_codon:yes gene_type:complete